MTPFFIFLHTICALLIIMVILMQSGRGGGLTEAFSSAETIFGPKTNVMMVKITVGLAGVFLMTSVDLAHLSSRKQESLIPETVASQTQKSTDSLIPPAAPKTPGDAKPAAAPKIPDAVKPAAVPQPVSEKAKP
jgi:preprotein translocase subunit SecG